MGSPDNEPTLKSLSQRQIIVAPDAGIQSRPDQALAAYRQFLQTDPAPQQRQEAMRRLGDLEMDVADEQLDTPGAPTGSPNYSAAIARYQSFLKAYPQDSGNDRVLYQLSRAQEQSGALEASLQTLNRLVADFPASVHHDEAHFRRGELLFSLRQYALAESAYTKVLQSSTANPYRERALYMQGWSLFKQGRLQEALTPFFGVLDVKLLGHTEDELPDTLTSLSRADMELVEDTLRVLSLSLQNLQGAESIPAYINTPVREAYQFRVYQNLGELYVKQDRIKDAADTFSAFAQAQPLHPQAPALQARVIGIYQQAGLFNLALQAKTDYVLRYGAAQGSRNALRARPLVQTYLAELAQHHHAEAQKTKTTARRQEAVRWYRSLLAEFPDAPTAARSRFLLAELLFEDGQFAQAATEYERVAYGAVVSEQNAEAGYAALLSLAAQEKQTSPEALRLAQQTSVDSALRFASTYAADPRAGAVLIDASEKLNALGDTARAALVAQQVLAMQPLAAPALRRTAWLVVGHAAFDRRQHRDAEAAYAQALALTPEKDAARAGLLERQAVTVYKQAEQARDAGQTRDAVDLFTRVAALAPQPSVRAAAEFDAATALMALKDWVAAARVLENFQKHHPQHALQPQVTQKLALTYLETQQWARAAAEFERWAAGEKDAAVARDALWQAGQLYEKQPAPQLAQQAFERYIKLYPQPLQPALEARDRLVKLARSQGNTVREQALLQDIMKAVPPQASVQEPIRTLGANAALALAQPLRSAYVKVALTEPLAKQLALKKSKFEEVLKAYALASQYGVASVTTQATFETGSLYQDFAQALLASQRPKKLNTAELAQYNVLLEEQAYPFEEKAMAVHDTNARRTTEGIFDTAVQSSFKALAQLRPARYAKSERTAVPGSSKPPSALNQLGIEHRQAGRFTEARAAYEQALALDPQDAAACVNLAILNDLYLRNAPRALELYERYLSLAGPDATVSKWMADLKNRKEPA